MTERRRATFQKTNIDDDGTIHPCFSINLSRLQVFMSLAVAVVTILTAVIGGVHWARAAVKDAADESFNQKADAFYRGVVPERNEITRTMIEAAIHAHQLEVTPGFELRLDGIQSEIVSNNAKIDNLIQEMRDHRQVLDELLTRSRNGS